MELSIVPKGSKYLVQDSSGQQVYTIKKKGFGYKYIIYDASNYALYTMSGDFTEKHPIYMVTHDGNSDPVLWIKCKSRFLEPSIIIKNADSDYLLKSEDKIHFVLWKEKEQVGTMEVNKMPNGDVQFSFTVNDKDFDDAWPFVALCVESSIINYKK